VDNLLLLNRDLGKLMAKAITMSDESDGQFRNSDTADSKSIVSAA